MIDAWAASFPGIRKDEPLGRISRSLRARIGVTKPQPVDLTLFTVTSHKRTTAWLIVPYFRGHWEKKLDDAVLRDAQVLVKSLGIGEEKKKTGWEIALASLDDDRGRENVLSQMESLISLLTGDSNQSDQRRTIAKEERLALEFDPKSVEDGRTRIAREIVARQGQGQFRADVLEAYERGCAISGCTEEAVLEAAHIFPYLGPDTNTVNNGLLLRADLHTLFDRDLLAIDPSNHKVIVSGEVHDPEYRRYSGFEIFLPKDPAKRPSHAALGRHLRESRLKP